MRGLMQHAAWGRATASSSSRRRVRQGRVVPGVRFRVASPDGRVAPWDDRTKGELEVKGNWVAESYYNDEKSAERFDDGWLRTGDIAVVDAQGSIQIIDRAKDLVKSGGEWIRPSCRRRASASSTRSCSGSDFGSAGHRGHDC